jgi:hypothetical protein
LEAATPTSKVLVDDALMQILAEGLRGDESVRAIILRGMESVTDIGAAFLADALPHSAVLHVDLYQTSVSMPEQERVGTLCTNNLLSGLAADAVLPSLEFTSSSFIDKSAPNRVSAVKYAYAPEQYPSGVPAKAVLDLSFSATVHDCTNINHYFIALSDVPKLCQALRNNTHVRRLSFTGVQICDSWMGGLAEAIGSSAVDVIYTSNTGVSEECYGVLARACMRNTVRRVAADDPAEVNIVWFSSLVTDNLLIELAEALHNNTHVLTVLVNEEECEDEWNSQGALGWLEQDAQSPSVTNAAASRLLIAMDTCVVERVCLNSSCVQVGFQAVLDAATFPRFLQRATLGKADQIQFGRFPCGYGWGKEHGLGVYKFLLDDGMLRSLADALRGNTAVADILFPCAAGYRNVDGSPVITDAAFSYLADAIAESAVNKFFSGGYPQMLYGEESPEFESFSGVSQNVQEAIQSHCARNTGIWTSLRT